MQAEDLLARKRALLEEASRGRTNPQAEAAPPGRTAIEMSEQDRVRRAEEFRQASRPSRPCCGQKRGAN